jgi:hypothetical protein
MCSKLGAVCWTHVPNTRACFRGVIIMCVNTIPLVLLTLLGVTRKYIEIGALFRDLVVELLNPFTRRILFLSQGVKKVVQPAGKSDAINRVP